MKQTPAIRIRALNDLDVNEHAEYVLYWMTAFRRGRYNFALQRAVEWSQRLNRALVVLEALNCDYRWASDRLHQFVIDGMVDNAAHFSKRSVLYYPYLEPNIGAGRGLLKALAGHACLVVSDDYPSFFLPRLAASAAKQVRVKFEIVDSNGLLPMRSADKVYSRAFDFRRFLQRNLQTNLLDGPIPDPLLRTKLPTIRSLSRDIVERWPATDLTNTLAKPESFSRFPIDHRVPKVALRGGPIAAHQTLKRFLREKIQDYETSRSDPDCDATSGLSPYLHFGHISVHQCVEEIMDSEQWHHDLLQPADGSSSGWWGTSAAAGAFLDELITWRELGFNMCWQRENYDQYESLPEWAQSTLAKHARDRRLFQYSLEEFECARTHDELWNAAQLQLVREGRIYNYLRMLWGKKILEWSAAPREALETMIELNNKYALDGRDPNSYSGIFWILGRYDRPWGPERPIFGTVRYMSSENTRRKCRVVDYIRHYSIPHHVSRLK